MKLVFSEHKSDYTNYIFPYAIWGFPESGENPVDMFNQGFLPSSRNLDRFYLCRNVRVVLQEMTLTSENRRVKRKGAGITHTLMTRAQFEYTAKRREFYKNYTDIRFGKDVMTYERLDALFNSPITSHVILFVDNATNAELGAVTLYMEKDIAYYYYGFYDLNYYSRNLGMYMMVSAVEMFHKMNLRYLYLGSCYSQNALYKTQFTGAEFFNGVRWSRDMDELKYLINREKKEIRQHLLETVEYRDLFYEGKLDSLVASSAFEVKINT